MQINNRHKTVAYGVYRIHLAKLQNGKWLHKITDRDYLDLAFGSGYSTLMRAEASAKQEIDSWSKHHGKN